MSNIEKIKEAHPEADILREDEYKIILLIDKVKEKEKDE